MTPNNCINNRVKLDAYHPIPIPIAHSCAIAYCLVRPSGAERPIATHPFHAIPSPLPLLESRRRGQRLLFYFGFASGRQSLAGFGAIPGENFGFLAIQPSPT